MKALWNTWVVRYDFAGSHVAYLERNWHGDWDVCENPDGAYVFGSREAAKAQREAFERDLGEDWGNFPDGKIVLRRGRYDMSLEESGGVIPEAK